MELVPRHLRRRVPGVLHDGPRPAAAPRGRPSHHLADGRPGPGDSLDPGHPVHPLTRSSIVRIALPVVVSGLLTTQALAADLSVNIEIPVLNVAEYHRPYVAMWIERANQSVAANLA